jgi:hypothetical protein
MVPAGGGPTTVVRDRPVIEALGFYREEALLEHGGHQEVGGVFSPE